MYDVRVQAEARKLYDFQTNTLDAFIISDRVRKVLESREISNAEYQGLGK